MKISYGVTVKDELSEISRLISFLEEHKREEDEIVVLWDDKGSVVLKQYLLDTEQRLGKSHFIMFSGEFEHDFADWKNKLNRLCLGNYIFQLDADEIPHLSLIQNLPYILETNPYDIFLVPRVNTVEGITSKHIQAWGWNLNEKQHINWPDFQWRIYKNTPKIQWKNKVHEVLTGYNSYVYFPAEEEFAIYHPKTIERQEKQNKYYSTL